MKYIIENVANMTYISSQNMVREAWDTATLTDRKLNNGISRIRKYDPNAQFEDRRG